MFDGHYEKKKRRNIQGIRAVARYFFFVPNLYESNLNLAKIKPNDFERFSKLSVHSLPLEDVWWLSMKPEVLLHDKQISLFYLFSIFGDQIFANILRLAGKRGPYRSVWWLYLLRNFFKTRITSIKSEIWPKVVDRRIKFLTFAVHCFCLCPISMGRSKNYVNR